MVQVNYQATAVCRNPQIGAEVVDHQQTPEIGLKMDGDLQTLEMELATRFDGGPLCLHLNL